MNVSSTEAKAELRRELRARLAMTSRTDREGWSRAACAHLIASDEFLRAGTVFVFVSKDQDQPEVLTTDLLAAALALGKRLCVPKIGQRRAPMRAVWIQSVERDCAPGYFGLLEPRGDREVAVDEVELIVTPGLAFDRHGGRLGQGGGYYDRYLATTPSDVTVFGLGFECQLVARVPLDRHDQRVGGLVTETGVRRFEGSTET